MPDKVTRKLSTVAELTVQPTVWREVELGEEEGTVRNTNFPKDFFASLRISAAKGFAIVSGSPTTEVLAP